MINNLLLYTAKVALGSSVMLGVYYLFYKKETFHKRNRVFLNFSMLLPLLVPLINISSLFNSTNEISSAPNNTPFSIVESSYYIESTISSSIEKFSFSEGLFYIYIIGITVSLVAIIRGFYLILRIIRRGEEVESNGTTITLSAIPAITPRSWVINIMDVFILSLRSLIKSRI